MILVCHGKGRILPEDHPKTENNSPYLLKREVYGKLVYFHESYGVVKVDETAHESCDTFFFTHTYGHCSRRMTHVLSLIYELVLHQIF